MTQGKHLVLVTGATRGLGRLVAERFWRAGDDLVLVARHEADLQQVRQELDCTARPGQCVHYCAADLSDLDQIPDLANTVQKKAGSPDILINNAAIQGPIGQFQTNDWAEWQNCMNVCLLAPVRLCQLFLPAMIENQYGRIINISGGGATAPRPNFSSYATAKCGLVRFSETLAQEMKTYGITVNCIAPGAMNSALTQEILLAGVQYAGSREVETATELSRNNPHIEERAADLVYFITSAPCSMITGKLISAVWDPWEKIPLTSSYLAESDVYTLRRIVPEDRNSQNR